MLGLSDRIELVAGRHHTTRRIRCARQNPLGKIPTLMLEDGTRLYDSRVILEYLDALAGGGKLIPAAEERFQRADPRRRSPTASSTRRSCKSTNSACASRRAQRTLARSSDRQDRARARRDGGAPPPEGVADAVTIALACALGYLDLRFAGGWRAEHPRLVAWLDAFAAAFPSFEATRFRG